MTANPSARRAWLIPTALILLTLVPMVAGSVRLAELSSGPEITPDNARYVVAPLPVVLHIVTACVYCVLGAFQFIPGPRSRGRRWHRYAGRLLVPTGILAALTGLWMTLVYPPLPGDGPALVVVRLVVGSAMVLAIVFGLVAVRRRQFGRHRAWMIRGYAIGQGAGTQVFTHLPWTILVGPPDGLPRLLMMTAGWAINIVIAEWIIRRPARHPRPAPGELTGGSRGMLGGWTGYGWVGSGSIPRWCSRRWPASPTSPSASSAGSGGVAGTSAR